MLVAQQRRSNQRQIDRRAKPARRSTRLRYPKTAAQRLHQSRSVHKNQNPQNGQLMARFDWGLGAVCFGASPVAAVFGSAPGSATPPEHRIHCKPSSQAAPIKQDISTLLGIGHFYFALTGSALESGTLFVVVWPPFSCRPQSSEKGARLPSTWSMESKYESAALNISPCRVRSLLGTGVTNPGRDVARFFNADSPIYDCDQACAVALAGQPTRRTSRRGE